MVSSNVCPLYRRFRLIFSSSRQPFLPSHPPLFKRLLLFGHHPWPGPSSCVAFSLFPVRGLLLAFSQFFLRASRRSIDPTDVAFFRGHHLQETPLLFFYGRVRLSSSVFLGGVGLRGFQRADQRAGATGVWSRGFSLLLWGPCQVPLVFPSLVLGSVLGRPGS